MLVRRAGALSRRAHGRRPCPLDIAIYFGNCSPVQFDETTRQVIARAIRERRASLGLSQEETAARSGGMVSTANLRVFEGAGRPTYRGKSLVGVARAQGDAAGRQGGLGLWPHGAKGSGQDSAAGLRADPSGRLGSLT